MLHTEFETKLQNSYIESMCICFDIKNLTISIGFSTSSHTPKINKRIVNSSGTKKFSSRKCTVCVTHRPHKACKNIIFLLCKVDVTFILNGLDLQMTLTFE